MPDRVARHSASIILAATLLLTAAIYWPGLHGGFLFDDFANLPALGNSGPVDNWPAFWRYITSGTADPTGRPLTLLTFLVDAHDWPADPFNFKRTNLFLHLFNGLLLAQLLKQLGYMAFPLANRRRTDLAAVLGASIWLIHPLFISTTLYIVQREAILPATFTLLGLLLWLRGRRAFFCARSRAGFAYITLGLGACSLLGTLSKANGILLPTLALVIEFALLRPSTPAAGETGHTKANLAGYRRSMLWMAWLPTALVGAYLAHEGWIGFTQGILSVRPWTLGQRLLTEPRIVMRYIDLLWRPRPFTAGLFHDDIHASTSWWTPYTTMPSILAVLGLILAAWRWRLRRPALATALLFYFVGQSIESSTIPLELYFEHRNYLPAMLMFWPLALWLCDVHAGVAAQTTPAASSHNTDGGVAESGQTRRSFPFTDTRSVRNLKIACTILVVLMLAMMTNAGARLWGDTHDQALLWAALSPASPRAQANAASVERIAGHPELAIQRLKRLLPDNPDEIQLALNLFSAECQNGNIDSSTLAASRLALGRTHDTGVMFVHWFEELMDGVKHPPCPQLNAQSLSGLLDAAQANSYLTATPGHRQDLYYLRGRLSLLQGNPDQALADFNRALDARVSETVALQQAALLGANGYPELGLAHLDHFKTVQDQAAAPSFGMQRMHAWVLDRQQYWLKEQTHLRDTLSEDAHNKMTGAK